MRAASFAVAKRCPGKRASPRTVSAARAAALCTRGGTLVAAHPLRCIKWCSAVCGAVHIEGRPAPPGVSAHSSGATEHASSVPTCAGGLVFGRRSCATMGKRWHGATRWHWKRTSWPTVAWSSTNVRRNSCSRQRRGALRPSSSTPGAVGAAMRRRRRQWHPHWSHRLSHTSDSRAWHPHTRVQPQRPWSRAHTHAALQFLFGQEYPGAG